MDAAPGTLPQTRRSVVGMLAMTMLVFAACFVGALVAAHITFFAVRTEHLLAYPFVLDYGEGPLLAQVDHLRSGTPIWRLYADPAQAPYLVVNYPPVYLLAAWLISMLSTPLLAGRLVSLAATLTAGLAIALLAGQARAQGGRLRNRALPALAALLFLGIPIVREWGAVMRVDMLGLALGLLALGLIKRRAGSWAMMWAAPVLAASLLVKPTLIAAPLAAGVWLLFRDAKRAIALGTLTAVLVGGAGALLQFASGGWFALNVVSANANGWDGRLAYQFWRDQMVLMTPLMLAGAVVAGWNALRSRHTTDTAWLLPVYYTLWGLIAAFGVGKLGAYTNYFLEAYAGLIWLAATPLGPGREHGARGEALRNGISAVVLVLAGAALLRYYPLWSEEYLLPAGMIEGENPARVSFGSRGVWQDLKREQVILAARAQINLALAPEIQASGEPLVTDIPGLAAQNGRDARLQVFEHRMLYDAGLWDQRPFLRELGNGAAPVIILDYLGNWLTPEMMTLITTRYVQDVSVGPYSIYRPLALPPLAALAAPPAFAGIELLRAGVGSSDTSAGPFAPGEILVVSTEWRSNAAPPAWQPQVVLTLTTPEGDPLLESAQPLLYGALAPADWNGETMQHIQALTLPAELPPGQYGLTIHVRDGERELGAPTVLSSNLTVQESGGLVAGNAGWFVPPALAQVWQIHGGAQHLGDPVMPAVAMGDYVEQCFQRACLRQHGSSVEWAPVGAMLWLADAGFPRAAIGSFEQDAALLALWNAEGGERVLGPPIGQPIIRFGYITQYTRYARLERWYEGGQARLGNVGEDIFRLPGGTPYRWPPALEETP